jgi:hypothetical protein
MSCLAITFLFSELRWAIPIDLDENFESRDVFPVDWAGLGSDDFPLLVLGLVEGSMRLGRDLNWVRWTMVGSSWMNNWEILRTLLGSGGDSMPDTVRRVNFPLTQEFWAIELTAVGQGPEHRDKLAADAHAWVTVIRRSFLSDSGMVAFKGCSIFRWAVMGGPDRGSEGLHGCGELFKLNEWFKHALLGTDV